MAKKTEKRPKADPKWALPARRLWQRTLETFALEDEHELSLLSAACVQVSRACAIAKALKTEGLIVPDRFKIRKPNPLLTEERQAQNLARLLLRELGLSAEPPETRGPRDTTYQ